MSNANPLMTKILDRMRDTDRSINENLLLDLMGRRRSSGLRGILHTKRKPIMKKEHVALLHIISGLALEEFEPDLKEEKEYKTTIDFTANKSKLFTSDFRGDIRKFKDQSDTNIKVFNLGENPNADGYDTLYLDNTLNLFEDATKSIFVIELLLKGDNNAPNRCLKKYRNAHEKLFDVIETKLKNDSSFSYKRIFSLSPSISIHNKSISLPISPLEVLTEDQEKAIKKTKKEIIDAFLIESSRETLSHIKRCLKIKKDTGNDNIVFQITPQTRFRHHCVIDDKYLLTEDYIKSKVGVIPDQIIIDRFTIGGNNLTSGIKTIMDNLSKGCITIQSEMLNEVKIRLMYETIQQRFEARTFLLDNYENMLSNLEANKKRKYLFEIKNIENRLKVEESILNNHFEDLLFKFKKLTKF